MTSMRHPIDFEPLRLTHPLPQVVLTVSKCVADRLAWSLRNAMQASITLKGET